MIIWRVQGPDGLGPYQREELSDELSGNSTERQPGPYSDFDFNAIMGKLGSDWYFGFPCLAAAYQWFGRKRLARLTRRGYALTPIEVRDSCVIISESRRQCIFEMKGVYHEETP